MRSRDARLNAWLAPVLLSAIGCASLQPVRDPAQFIPQHLPARVWVVTTNNATLAVAQPRIDGDTLRGTWEGRSAPLAVPLRDIERVEAVQRDKTRRSFWSPRSRRSPPPACTASPGEGAARALQFVTRTIPKQTFPAEQTNPPLATGQRGISLPYGLAAGLRGSSAGLT